MAAALSDQAGQGTPAAPAATRQSLEPSIRLAALALPWLWSFSNTPSPFLPSQVRANSLQELVYKQGQAGVTKATVSIVFDNRDKERRCARAQRGPSCSMPRWRALQHSGW